MTHFSGGNPAAVEPGCFAVNNTALEEFILFWGKLYDLPG
jgi:hypothetical protein